MMVVQTSPKNPHMPQCVMDKVSRKFFEVIFGMAVEDLLVKYEGYALSRIHGKQLLYLLLSTKFLPAQITTGVTKNYNEWVLLTQSWVRDLVTKGLREYMFEIL